jgi:multidrug resistance efflux pump
MKFGVPRNLSVKKAVNVLIPISLLGLSNILVILEISTKSEVIAFGYIDAENKIKICANISGIIDSVFIQEGQEVKIGDKLLTIDSRKIQRELFSLYTEYQNLQDELIELNKAANLLAQNYMFESYGGNVSLQQLKIHLDEATEKYSIAETLFVKGMISRCERDDKKRNYLAALTIYDTYQHSIEMQKRKYEKLITQKKREIELIKSKIADTEEAIDKSVVYAPISGLCHLPTALFAGKKLMKEMFYLNCTI